MAGETLNSCELVHPSPRLGSTLPRESEMVIVNRSKSATYRPPDLSRKRERWQIIVFPDLKSPCTDSSIEEHF